MFLWTPKGCISLSRIFLDFFLICIFHHGSGKVSNLWLRLLVNTFVIQKIESVHFYSCPPSKTLPQVFIITPRQKEITYYFQTAFSEDIFFPSRKGGEDYGIKKLPKLNLEGYWSHVLINSTIFATFTFLVFVLLCHNLASSMLKCEVPLT